jgi:hypothetical protein
VDCDEQPYPAGTGFGFEFAGEKYLITARHVLAKDERNNCDSDGKLFVFASGKLTKLDYLSLDFDMPDGSQRLSSLDVSILLVRTALADAIGAKFFTESDIDGGAPAMHKYYAAVGFPKTKNGPRYGETVLKNRPYMYAGKASQDRTCYSVGLSPDMYLCFDILLKKTYTRTQKQVKAPKPHGISGGPIFYIHDFSCPFQCLRPTLYGIVTGYKVDGKCMVGPRIAPIIEGLRAHRRL